MVLVGAVLRADLAMAVEVKSTDDTDRNKTTESLSFCKHMSGSAHV
jgi:hypothetical protein